MDWGGLIQQGIQTGAKAIGDLISGSGGDDRLQSFQDEVMPTALGTARSQNKPVFAYWYGLILGVAPTGQVIQAGEVPTATQADAAIGAWAAKYGISVLAINSLSPYSVHEVAPGGANLGPVSTSGGFSTAGMDTSWLLIAGVALAAYFLFSKKK